jgi:hypothetical protein
MQQKRKPRQSKIEDRGGNCKSTFPLPEVNSLARARTCARARSKIPVPARFHSWIASEGMGKGFYFGHRYGHGQGNLLLQLHPNVLPLKKNLDNEHALLYKQIL